MPFDSIRDRQYHKALKKLPGLSRSGKKGDIHLNPARQFLLFFEGTNQKDLDFFQSLHRVYEKKGIRIKMLSFLHTREDVEHFAMAMYNEKSVRWNHLPKPRLIELVRSRKFDILLNINPNEYKHMHFLAVAANADFKVSTLSSLPNDFNLTVKISPDLDQKKIYEEMIKCLDTLSV